MPGKNILVVENDDSIIDRLQFLIRNLGHTPVGPVACCHQAFRAVEELRPDLVLVDVALLDGVDGIDTANQHMKCCEIPVIFLADFGDEALLRSARSSNPYAYIIKPVQQNELSVAVELALYKREMEQRLRKSESRYQRLFETMTSGFVLLDVVFNEHNQVSDYAILDVNSTLLRMLDMTRAMLIGHRMSEIVDGDCSMYLNLYKEVVRSGVSAQMEYYFAERDTYLELRAFSPDPGRLAVILNDVSDRRRAEQAVVESELRFRQMAETVNEVFWLRSRDDGRLLYINPAYQRIWGRSIENLYAHPQAFYDGVHPDDLARIMRARQELVLNGIPFNEEYRIVRPDGEQRWVWARTFAVREADGQVVRYSGIAEDITERKHTQHEMMQSYLRTEQALRRMTVLRNIDMAITTHTDRKTMIDTVLNHITNLTDVDAALMFCPNEAAWPEGTLRMVGKAGLSDAALTALPLDAIYEETERVYQSGQVSASANLSSLAASGMNACITRSLGFASYSFLPLVTKGQAKGVLLLLSRSINDKNLDLHEFFQSLALQAAIAVDHVDMFQGMKRSNCELRHAYDETIKGWAQALELRSADTRGHCDRVVQLSEVLARSLGMSEAELVHFRRGVMLHDIGKLGIPDSILLKAGTLTPEEWEAIKLHPVYGYEMLRDIEYLRPAVNVPYCHHERWDGSGYPRGLAGTDIPREARIFAVVDAWDALISERPYHPPWPPAEAMQYLTSQAGKQFDPEVVTAFLKLL